jgi:hypothetical protein
MLKRIWISLAGLLIVAGIIVAYRNYQEANRLAAAVTTADAAAVDTTASLVALKTYVATHMGAAASLTLTGSYARAQEAARAQAAAQAANSQVYAQAQAACAGKSDSITQAKCVQSYLAQHVVSQPNPTPVVEPVLANYQYRYRAPLWTPDLAGGLMLAGAAVVVWLMGGGVRRRLRRRR